MKITCKDNDYSRLPKTLQRFAFMQDQNGIMPLTPGEEYTVYGLKENSLGNFVLVVPDGERLPWWMPSSMFNSDQSPLEVPSSWGSDEYPSAYGGIEKVKAPKAYFGHEEDIEDSEPAGYEAFEAMEQG